MATSATEFLFGEAAARVSFKALLREYYRLSREELAGLKQAHRQNRLNPQYWQRVYQLLQAYPLPIRSYPGPVRKLVWYCVRNFPAKGFILDASLWGHFSEKALTLRRRKGRFRRGFRRSYRRYFKRFRRGYRRRRSYRRVVRKTYRRTTRRYYRRRY